METPEVTIGEVLEEAATEDAELRPKFDEKLDILAFELWQRGSRQDLAADEEASDDEESVGHHASCL
ncbi:MAG TPA: hypothetical protein VMH81_04540 [Bryobacteraceae bacterium]|nr:hypothetical protein [Bryobacteraceae bacterium]